MADTIIRLSDSQRETLFTFQSIVNLPNLRECQQILEAHAWNLEHAVNFAFALKQGGDFPPQPAATPRVRNATTTTTTTATTTTSPAPAAAALPAATIPIEPAPSTSTTSASSQNVFWRALRWLRRMASPIFPCPRERDRIGNAHLLKQLRSTYGALLPNFVEGTYSNAESRARDANRLLFVYLHAPDHVNTDEFLRTTLCTEGVRNFLNDHFTCWTGSVSSIEAYKLSEVLVATSFPFVALLAPQRASQPGVIGLIHRQAGMISGDDLIGTLVLQLEELGVLMDPLEQQQQQQQQRQTIVEGKERKRSSASSIIAQQDEEYQQALEQDRKRRQAEEEARKQALEAELEVKRQREAEEKQAKRREEALQTRKAFQTQLLAQLPSEPAAAASQSDVLALAVRLSGGKKVQRRFTLDVKLQTVFDFINGQDLASLYPDDDPIQRNAQWLETLTSAQTQTQTKGSIHPDVGPYVLVMPTASPRRVFDDAGVALRELNLPRATMLFMEELDE